MPYPILHFGYFDHEALRRGQLVVREPFETSRLGLVFREIFGPLPGRDVPRPGFFSSYGVLACVCPCPSRGERLPVEAILDFVLRSRCDVVYATATERWIVEVECLPDLLCPSELDPGDDEAW